MSQYTQLTQEQRYQIYAFLKAGFLQKDIACEIGVHKSTICQEIRRNRGQRGYRAKQANSMAVQRRREANKSIKMTPEIIVLINRYLRQDFSPEQVSGFLARKHNIHISHERIYQHVLEDKARGGCLYRHLRHAKKIRRKRYGSGSYDRRGRIKARVSIDERPAIVDSRKRIGDWEIDTMIGKKQKGVLLTLVERKSKLTLIKKVSNKQADLVAEAAINLLNPYRVKVFTITADNGREFYHHEHIKEQLKTDVYFAHPYHAWERGLSENTNGLIRQYFPKGLNFQTIKREHVQKAMDRLNNRPRKTLGFKTPNEVFFQVFTKQAA
jgi:IS30 family transposase